MDLYEDPPPPAGFTPVEDPPAPAGFSEPPPPAGFRPVDEPDAPAGFKDVGAPLIKEKVTTQSTIGRPRTGAISSEPVLPQLAEGVVKGYAGGFMDPLGKIGKIVKRNSWAVPGAYAPFIGKTEFGQAVEDMGSSVEEYYAGRDTQARMAPASTAEQVGQVGGGLGSGIVKYANPAGQGIAAGEALLGGAAQYETAREKGASPLKALPAAAINTAVALAMQKIQFASGGNAARVLATPGLAMNEAATAALKDLGVSVSASVVQQVVDNMTTAVGGADPSRELLAGVGQTAATNLAMPISGYLRGRGAANRRVDDIAALVARLREIGPRTVDATGTGDVSFKAPLSRKAARYAYMYERPANTEVAPVSLVPSEQPTASPVARPPLTDMYEGARNNIQGDELARIPAEYDKANENVAWKVEQLIEELKKKGKLSKPKMKRLTELRNSMTEQRLGMVNREQAAQEEAVRRLDDTDLSDWLGFTPQRPDNAPDMIASEIGRTPSFETSYGQPRIGTSPIDLAKAKFKAARPKMEIPDVSLPEARTLPESGTDVGKIRSLFTSSGRLADIDPQMKAGREPIREYTAEAERYQVRHGAVREPAEKLGERELDQVATLLSAGRRRGTGFTADEARQAGVSESAHKVYTDIRDDYQNQIKDLKDAALERYSKSGDKDFAEEAKYYDKVAEANPEYAPFGRTGKYALTLKDDTGAVLAYMTADSKVKLKMDEALLRASEPSLKGAKAGEIRLAEAKDFKGKSKAPNTAALEEAARILKDDYGIDMGVNSSVLADMYRNILAEKESRGFAGRMLKAKLTPGESRDFIAQHYAYTNEVANRVAQLKHGHDVEANLNTLRKMDAEAPAAEQENIRRNMGLLASEWDYLKAGGAGKGVRRTSAATTGITMGGDLAQLIIQPVQKVTHSFWSHAAEFGYKEGAKAQLRGNALATKIQARNMLRSGDSDYTLTHRDVDGFVPKGQDVERFAREATEDIKAEHESGGFMDVPRSTYMSSTPEPAKTEVGKALQKGLDWSLKPIQVGEYHNRMADYTAAYLAARKAGKSRGEARAMGIDLMERANNVSGDANTNEFVRRFPTVGPLAYKFKAFPQQFVELMHSNAKREYTRAIAGGGSKAEATARASVMVAGPLAVTAALAGYKAIPAINDAWEAARAFDKLAFSGSEEELMGSLPAAVDEFVKKENLPEWMADTIKMGAGSLLGIDVSGRFGLDRVVGLDSERGVGENAVNLLVGANRVTYERGGQLSDSITARDPNKLAKSLAPRGAVNIGTALEGEQKVAGGKTMQLTPAERVMAAAGIRSSRISKESEAGRIKRSTALDKTVKRAALRARLERANSDAERQAVIDDILEYNKNVDPEAAIRIPSLLRKKVKK